MDPPLLYTHPGCDIPLSPLVLTQGSTPAPRLTFHSVCSILPLSVGCVSLGPAPAALAGQSNVATLDKRGSAEAPEAAEHRLENRGPDNNGTLKT